MATRRSGTVVRVHEASGSSARSWEAAAADALVRAKREVPAPVGLEVARLWADVVAGKPVRFHATVRIAYRQALTPPPPAAGKKGVRG